MKIIKALLIEAFLTTIYSCYCSSVANSCPTFWDPMDCRAPGFPVLHYLPEFAQTRPLSQWCHPAISSFDPPPPASIRVFFSESALSIEWPKDWNFSFSISPSNKYSELISFRIDWFDFLAVQGTLKILIQHHNSKLSIFSTWPSLWPNSHICTWLLENPHLWLYGHLLAMMSLLFNTLSRFVIAFLPSSIF